ncbi:polysaccharide biosynthesis C-terminal domain-containing protein [Georgenia sp. TF02-10]|uniref:lipopolysaccharide biosynthesis protein n=1 Tax=Georgenia sp. TF02-10 TaxID=2917725 RepID=UPI001FA6C040|nr:polysaccharide biosynthesis C-terminal domain-containing protein [Georgenia sp. TF02-10]UNX55372.1 polysaccharide biosynthesis C-terminal domain-containing protein [Georgenia sp. TF02-10]
MSRRFTHPAYDLLAGQVVTAGVAFAINFLSSSVMPPDQRGTLAFFIQLSYIATTLGLLGVERPYVAERTGASFPTAVRELGRLTKSVWVGATLLVIAAVVTGWLSSWFMALLLAMTATYVVSNAAVRRVRIAYVVSRDRRTFVMNTIAVQCGLLGLGVVLYLFDVSSPAAWLGAYALSSAAAMVTTVRARRRSREEDVAASQLARVRREGLRLIPASLGNTALLRSDRLMMPFLSSAAELGIYVTVATVMEVGAWPIQQWVDASLGRLRERAAAGNNRRLVTKVFLGAVGLTTVIGVLAYFAISLLLPEEYHPSLQLIPILGAGTVVYAMTRLQHGWLIAEGRPGLVSVAETVGLVASAVLYVGLIPPFGAMGAAIGSGIGHCLLFGTTWWLRRRRKA